MQCSCAGPQVSSKTDERLTAVDPVVGRGIAHANEVSVREACALVSISVWAPASLVTRACSDVVRDLPCECPVLLISLADEHAHADLELVTVRVHVVALLLDPRQPAHDLLPVRLWRRLIHHRSAREARHEGAQTRSS